MTGNEPQARRYLDYWRILHTQRRSGVDRALEVATGYLENLDPQVAEHLRAEYALPPL